MAITDQGEEEHDETVVKVFAKLLHSKELRQR